ncbi:MAG: aspartate kinase [Bacillota bacterium]|jgi:aspartate kinase|nr:aspartate kinase [Bacillota bacterium]
MMIVIQKFGGTTVSSVSKRLLVAKRIKDTIDLGLSPIAVISAIGRLGEPYSTDSLLSLVRPNRIKARDLDLLMSVGEIISCVLMVDTLASIGVNAKPYTGGQAGIITDESYGKANILHVKPEPILECLKKGIVPVVAGFQGITEHGQITTLGRGGSDTSAAILAKAVDADRIEIYTDVDGIMTADPNIVKEARKLNELSYSELFEMADQGAKVIHPKAVSIAMSKQIPLIIKNIAGNDPGTLISNRKIEKQKKDLVTSIVHISGRCQVKALYDNSDEKIGILKELADKGISLDIINVFPSHMVFTIEKQAKVQVEQILASMATSFSVLDGLCKVSIIGEGMKGVPGVIYKAIKLLSEQGIEVLQTSDSHTTISCLIKEKDAERAVSILHQGYCLLES